MVQRRHGLMTLRLSVSGDRCSAQSPRGPRPTRENNGQSRCGDLEACSWLATAPFRRSAPLLVTTRADAAPPVTDALSG